MQEGSGAFGARVLSVMCCALTDGFRPQSGLVQRVVICRLLAVSLPMAAKPKQPPCGRRKCTPFGAAHHFPRRGKFTFRSTFTLISSSKYSVAKISPSGEDADAGGRRGAFLRATGAVVWFFIPRSGYKIHRRRRYHNPLNPLNLLNPLNPHARRACPNWRHGTSGCIIPVIHIKL
jgi:hypothetical protein